MATAIRTGMVICMSMGMWWNNGTAAEGRGESNTPPAANGAASLDARFRALPWTRDEATRAARAEAFNTADALLGTMNDKQWKSYLKLSSGTDEEKAKAAQMEKDAPLARFASMRLSDAIARLQKRRVPNNRIGVSYLYNHGFVLEAGGKRLGIDIAGPGLEPLAESLDALLVSHWHEDHYNEALLAAMLAKGKEVFACGYDGSPTAARKTKGPGLRIPKEGEQISVGALRLTFHRGDHYPQSFVRFNPQIKVSEKNVLDTLIEIDLPDRPRPVLVFHDGDDFNKASKLSVVAERRVDLFLGHGVPSPTMWADPKSKTGQLWRDLNESIGDPFATALAIKPRFFVPGHMAERNHGDNIGGCTPFSVAGAFCDLLEKETGGATTPLMLMWGETIELEMTATGDVGVNH